MYEPNATLYRSAAKNMRLFLNSKPVPVPCHSRESIDTNLKILTKNSNRNDRIETKDLKLKKPTC